MVKCCCRWTTEAFRSWANGRFRTISFAASSSCYSARAGEQGLACVRRVCGAINRHTDTVPGGKAGRGAFRSAAGRGGLEYVGRRRETSGRNCDARQPWLRRSRRCPSRGWRTLSARTTRWRTSLCCPQSVCSTTVSHPAARCLCPGLDICLLPSPLSSCHALRQGPGEQRPRMGTVRFTSHRRSRRGADLGGASTVQCSFPGVR